MKKINKTKKLTIKNKKVSKKSSAPNQKLWQISDQFQI